MCGIFGYVGHKRDAGKIVAEGLKRLDYRGYDSWGVAIGCDEIIVAKKAGKISEVQSFDFLPSSNIGIAHIRWATTGAVNDINAHPHYAKDKSFVLAQNGIVENYQSIKSMLIERGYLFIGETDTEVVTYLIEEKMKVARDLKEAVALAFAELEGRNTIILLTKDRQIIAARHGSPLVVGVNSETKEIYLSSDVLSFAELVHKVLVVDNGQMIHINGTVRLYNVKTMCELAYNLEDVRISNYRIDKEHYDHFMLKEINEAPFVLSQLIEQDKNKCEELAAAVKLAKNVYTIGSGGAGVAASQAAFYLRDIGKIKAVSLIGADAVEYMDLFGSEDLIIVFSQSGETADVLEVLEEAKKKDVKIASFVNMPGSMITRMSDYKFLSESGPEICVMSTKTFDAQISFGYLLAKTIVNQGEDARKKIKDLAVVIDNYLNNAKNCEVIKNIARLLCQKKNVYLIGKYQNFHIIREGMVKIIEASYLHGHALPSGDLKHYVITLMEPGVPVIVVVSNDKTKKDVMNAVDQIHLRGAMVISISSEDYKYFDHFISVPDTGETSAIMNLIPLQLLAYYMAVELGNNVDKPRNIAKSVTVK